MGKLDIIILILVGLGGWSCFRAGFTRSVWGLAAVSAGLFAASHLWQEVSPLLGRFIAHQSFTKWVSIIAIAVGVSILADMVFDRLQTVMDRGILGWVNSVVGAAFGGASSGILLGFLFLLLSHYGGDGLHNAIDESRFAPRLVELAHQVFDLGKDAVQRQVGRM